MAQSDRYASQRGLSANVSGYPREFRPRCYVCGDGRHVPGLPVFSRCGHLEGALRSLDLGGCYERSDVDYYLVMKGHYQEII